ncbi:MAG: magnetosome protein MamC [Deltaproteobacteria bacterium]|nr:magnetosome protein MamC [Deltaproteobacteria bacterium]
MKHTHMAHPPAYPHTHMAYPSAYYPTRTVAYPYPTRTVSPLVPRVSLISGVLGAVVVGAGAAAKGIRLVKAGEMTREEAVTNTFQEAAGGGIATATAAAVVGTLGAAGILGFLAFVATATGTKYLWDSAVSPEKK